MKNAKRLELERLTVKAVDIYKGFNKEFDPGSGRTLAARLTHASRTEMFRLNLRRMNKHLSGERVSNA